VQAPGPSAKRGLEARRGKTAQRSESFLAKIEERKVQKQIVKRAQRQIDYHNMKYYNYDKYQVIKSRRQEEIEMEFIRKNMTKFGKDGEQLQGNYESDSSDEVP